MPWKRLSSWFARQSVPVAHTPPALTLATLIVDPHADPTERAFYAQAEFETLAEWARTGRFVLAFAATEREELTLVCTEDAAAVDAALYELPLIASGLAYADVRDVMPLRVVRSATNDIARRVSFPYGRERFAS